jgi:maleate isomerase
MREPAPDRACRRVLAEPVVAINTATYWSALRSNGIADRRDGFGALPRDY